MAQRSLILSNNDGRATFSNTSSIGVSIEDSPATSGHISASYITFDQAKLANISLAVTGTFLSSSFGRLTSSAITLVGTTLSGALGWNGSMLVATNIIAEDYSGSVPDTAQSDLRGVTSGSYKYDIHVKNVSNINRGSLPVKFGGTGLSGSNYYLNNGIILKVSGGLNPTINALSASSDMSGSVLSSINNEILTMKPGQPYIKFYNVPGTYTWTKPPNTTMARVLCQGGGGGGSTGQNSGTDYRGHGGNSGGFSDALIFLTSSDNITVTVGAGGSGGNANSANVNASFKLGSAEAGSRGTSGGNSSFGNYISASGGNSANVGSSTDTVAGTGITFTGSSGATHIAQATTANNVSSGGGGGGNPTGATSGGTVTIFGLPNNIRDYGYKIDSTGKIIDITFGSGSNGQNSGSLRPTAPTSYGAGGGGGYVSPTSIGSGGPGAGGYVLVIAW